MILKTISEGLMNLQAQPLLTGIAKLRRAKNLSQRELATRLEITQSHLCNIETGKSDLRLGTFVELARYLGAEVMLVPVPLVPLVESILVPSADKGEGKKARWAVEDEEVE